jgi:hypothetical protein
MVSRLDSRDPGFARDFDTLLNSKREVSEEVGTAVANILTDVKARGDAAVFLRFPPPSYREKIWDHCAGVLISQEAGATVRPPRSPDDDDGPSSEASRRLSPDVIVSRTLNP